MRRQGFPAASIISAFHQRQKHNNRDGEQPMNVLIIQANQKLYASEGNLNGALSLKSKEFFSSIDYDTNLSDVTEPYEVEQEVEKLKVADLIIYHFPLWWFGVPYSLKRYFDEVLIHKETFIISDIYGEGGQLQDKKFLLSVTSNMKKSDLGTVPILKGYSNIDDILSQIIITNRYLGVRKQLDTFHADNVIQGDTSSVLDNYEKHLKLLFNA